MWHNISTFNIQMIKLVRHLVVLSSHRPGTGFSLNTAFLVSINSPVLHKPWDDSIITNAQHTAHTINTFKLMNLVTAWFYFCLLSKTKQSQWSYWNCFYKIPWHFQLNPSEQHTKYWEAIISFYGTFGADFFNFSTTQLCDIFILYKWRHFAASLYLSFPLLEIQSLKKIHR